MKKYLIEDYVVLGICLVILALTGFIIYTVIMMAGISLGGWDYPQFEPIARYLKGMMGK